MTEYHRNALRRRTQIYLDWFGNDYVFIRPGRNEFHEVDDSVSEEITVRGVFHDSGRKLDIYRVLNMTTYGTYTSESMPQIFGLYEAISKVRMHDKLVINGQDYIVTGTFNIQEMNLLGEISLKHIQEPSTGDDDGGELQ